MSTWIKVPSGYENNNEILFGINFWEALCIPVRYAGQHALTFTKMQV